MDGCAFTLVLLVVAVILFVVADIQAREKGRRAYVASLAALKRNPASPEHREETLRRGRHYAHLMRKKRGRTLFDEVALMNDINAACAAASAAAPRASVEERLARLQDLETRGLISDDEYHERRREILREV